MNSPGREWSNAERDGREAPSPESRRRRKSPPNPYFTSLEDEDSVFTTTTNPPPGVAARNLLGRTRISSNSTTTMYQDDEDEFGFLETKPIMADPTSPHNIKSKKVAEPREEDVLSFGDEDEPRYFKESRTPSRTPLRAVRDQSRDYLSQPGMTTDNESAKKSDDMRRHFLRRHGDRKVSDVPADLAMKDEFVANLALDTVAASPNPPGINEKIESFLEGMKHHSSSTAAKNSLANSDTLMQVWPADMERLLRSPETLLTNLDCTLEEYIDIICALLGVPVYESRIEALHQVFTLFVDYRELSA